MIRDKAVRPFGVNSSQQLRQHGMAARHDHIDLFRIMSSSREEIVLGNGPHVSLDVPPSECSTTSLQIAFSTRVRP